MSERVFVVTGCHDCAFYNTDADVCNVDDADEKVEPWEAAGRAEADKNCPLRLGPVVHRLATHADEEDEEDKPEEVQEPGAYMVVEWSLDGLVWLQEQSLLGLGECSYSCLNDARLAADESCKCHTNIACWIRIRGTDNKCILVKGPHDDKP